MTVKALLLPKVRDIRSEVVRLNITRRNVWDGTMRGMRRPNFSPSKTLLIKFTDDIGQPEGAIDQGGPKREFFRLVLDYMFNYSGMFEGDGNEKFISGNLSGNDEYILCQLYLHCLPSKFIITW